MNLALLKIYLKDNKIFIKIKRVTYMNKEYIYIRTKELLFYM